MPLWSMASKPDQIKAVQAFDTVQTLDDHLRDGGFGSWLMEAVVGQPGVETRLRAHALTPAVCGTVGSQNMLNALGGLGTTPPA
jgi:transketolase